MLSTKHSFAWSGQIPCTGVYTCIHCGHVEKDAHPLSVVPKNYAYLSDLKGWLSDFARR